MLQVSLLSREINLLDFDSLQYHSGEHRSRRALSSELPPIALGCITRFIESAEPYKEFVENARDCGHPVGALIIALTRSADLAVVAELNELIEVEIIEVDEDDDLPDELVEVGATPEDVWEILDTSPTMDYGLVPFCVQRNSVMLKALLLGYDILVFFDHNMRPVELVGDADAQSGRGFRDLDFLGPHLDGILSGAAVTTGAYSGFDAFPPLQMGTMRDLLHGLGREEAFDVISAEGALSGVYLPPEQPPPPRSATQAFAGNLGLDLRQAEKLPPFFSRSYTHGSDVVLTRGEDTLLGAAATWANIGCIDVGTRVFLDPHATFPSAPDVSQERMKTRLYWNCLGWIARLPLLDHVRHDCGLLDWNLEELEASRRLALQQGSIELAEVLRDNRFLDLPTFFDLAFLRIGRTLAEYNAARAAWRRIVKAIRGERDSLWG